jgi:hypothetical protein
MCVDFSWIISGSRERPSLGFGFGFGAEPQQKLTFGLVSVSAERGFKKYGRHSVSAETDTMQRSVVSRIWVVMDAGNTLLRYNRQLLNENAEKLLFLNYNIRLFGFNY